MNKVEDVHGNYYIIKYEEDSQNGDYYPARIVYTKHDEPGYELTTFKTVEKYAYRATFDEIKEHDFNMNIPRYVDTFEEEEEIDIPAVRKEIEGLEKELTDVRKEMDGYLKELGFDS